MATMLLLPTRLTTARELVGHFDRAVIAGPSKRTFSSSPKRTPLEVISRVNHSKSSSGVFLASSMPWADRSRRCIARRALSSTAWRARPPDGPTTGGTGSKSSSSSDSPQLDSAARSRDSNPSETTAATTGRPLIPTEHLPEARPSEPTSTADPSASSSPSTAAISGETSSISLTASTPQTHNAALDPDAVSTHKSEKNQAEADWRIILKLAENIWPRNSRGTKLRVVGALGLLIGGKVLNVQVPFFFKQIVDSLNVPITAESTVWVLAGSAIAGCECCRFDVTCISKAVMTDTRGRRDRANPDYTIWRAP